MIIIVSNNYTTMLHAAGDSGDQSSLSTMDHKQTNEHTAGTVNDYYC